MKKTPLITVLLITTLLMGGTAFAWHGERGNRGQMMTIEQHENRLERMAVILDLSDDQKNQIKELSTAQWQERQADRAKLQTSRDALRVSGQAQNFNEADFRAKAQQHANLRTEMMVDRAKLRQQVDAILTPEQQQKAEKLREMRNKPGKNKRKKTGKHNGYGKNGGKGKRAGSF